MENKAVTSALDIVNWFCRKADTAGVMLEEAKIQHLLFLAQIHFALKSGHFLMPSLFVCGRGGFYEPTIRQIMRFGLPLMSKPSFDSSIDDFLELIWQKYAPRSEADLYRFIRSLECWKQSYRPETEVIVDPMRLADSFADSIRNARRDEPASSSGIRLSQNGPVRVSAWHPRKLKDSNKIKENTKK